MKGGPSPERPGIMVAGAGGAAVSARAPGRRPGGCRAGRIAVEAGLGADPDRVGRRTGLPGAAAAPGLAGARGTKKVRPGRGGGVQQYSRGRRFSPQFIW